MNQAASVFNFNNYVNKYKIQAQTIFDYLWLQRKLE